MYDAKPLRHLDPERSGGKAAGLKWLVDHGYAVPATWVLPKPESGPDALRQALADVVLEGRAYAVRSSANVEDGGEMLVTSVISAFALALVRRELDENDARKLRAALRNNLNR